MFEKLAITRMAQGLAAHAAARQGVVAQNVANADTPGYRAMDMVDFATAYAAADNDMRHTRTGHSTAAGMAAEPAPQARPGDAAPNGNTVSLEGEMVRAVEVRQQHDMALAIYRSTADILRVSLGRAR